MNLLDRLFGKDIEKQYEPILSVYAYGRNSLNSGPICDNPEIMQRLENERNLAENNRQHIAVEKVYAYGNDLINSTPFYSTPEGIAKMKQWDEQKELEKKLEKRRRRKEFWENILYN
jgi:Icc-related predicted phosphoesterase